MGVKLDEYVNLCLELDCPTDTTLAKNFINQRLLKYFI